MSYIRNLNHCWGIFEQDFNCFTHIILFILHLLWNLHSAHKIEFKTHVILVVWAFFYIFWENHRLTTRLLSIFRCKCSDFYYFLRPIAFKGFNYNSSRLGWVAALPPSLFPFPPKNKRSSKVYKQKTMFGYVSFFLSIYGPIVMKFLQ